LAEATRSDPGEELCFVLLLDLSLKLGLRH
jgi:hypothetical protein